MNTEFAAREAHHARGLRHGIIVGVDRDVDIAVYVAQSGGEESTARDSAEARVVAVIDTHALGTVTDDLSLALNGEVFDRCVFTMRKQTVAQIICIEVCDIPVKVEIIDRMTVAFKGTAESSDAGRRRDLLPVEAFKVNIVYKLKIRR